MFRCVFAQHLPRFLDFAICNFTNGQHNNRPTDIFKHKTAYILAYKICSSSAHPIIYKIKLESSKSTVIDDGLHVLSGLKCRFVFQN